jgi:hypothetical protein
MLLIFEKVRQFLWKNQTDASKMDTGITVYDARKEQLIAFGFLAFTQALTKSCYD